MIISIYFVAVSFEFCAVNYLAMTMMFDYGSPTIALIAEMYIVPVNKNQRQMIMFCFVLLSQVSEIDEMYILHYIIFVVVVVVVKKGKARVIVTCMLSSTPILIRNTEFLFSVLSFIPYVLRVLNENISLLQ